MNAGYVIGILAVYFSLLFLVSWLTTRKTDAATFFIANRNAPWPLVAYGMIGVAISGITFISVPGQVADSQFSYFQLVIGYSLGLLVVAFVLLPVFYRIRAISIYSFLNERYGYLSHKTGAVFFLVAQVATASFKLFLMAHVLQLVLFNSLGWPFWLTVLLTLLLIWLYTYRGGIKTVIFTDTLQTTFLILSLILSIWTISGRLDLSFVELYRNMESRGISRIFFWSWDDPFNFFKLVLTGLLLTVMTNGLDQSVMQKHLTCRDLLSSQKNIVALAVILLGVNILFLFLGGSLSIFSDLKNIPIPERTDNLYPLLAINHLGLAAGTFFLIGIAAAAYSSADSSLTGLTTSFCIDVLNFKEKEDNRQHLRQGIHLGFTLLIFILIMVFSQVNNESVLYAFIRTSGFIYGPLVGLFAFGLFSKRKVRDHWIPVISILAPIVSILLDQNSEKWFYGYKFGYDILVVNSLITYLGLYFLSKKDK
ncbi:MAG: sodium:solute symporter [Cyclobacteriaceae bacterium]|nr:sodium:solute symporter [Cyclobacteriaceae bacterium]